MAWIGSVSQREWHWVDAGNEGSRRILRGMVKKVDAVAECHPVRIVTNFKAARLKSIFIQ